MQLSQCPRLAKIPELWIIALQKVYFLKIKIMNK